MIKGVLFILKIYLNLLISHLLKFVFYKVYNIIIAYILKMDFLKRTLADQKVDVEMKV